jgi:carbon storage regulator
MGKQATNWEQHYEGGRKKMLVVARRKNESIMIQDDIEVTILEIRCNQVKIGIEAPRDIPVNRREVYERIKAEEQAKDSAKRQDDMSGLSPWES